MVSWKYYGQRLLLVSVTTSITFIIVFFASKKPAATDLHQIAYHLSQPNNKERGIFDDLFMGKDVLAIQQSKRDFPETCNLTWFKQELDVTRWPPIVPRQLLSQCTRVVYNRIPKCGSRTFRDVFAHLAPQHNISHIYIDQDWWALTENEEYRNAYVESMKKADGRFILTSHFYFHEFPDVYDPDTMIYIDLTREPAAWFESAYSWNRYGSAEKPFSVAKHVNLKEKLPDCIHKTGGCVRELAFAGPLWFLCGTDTVCHAGNHSHKSVARAIDNVDKHYLTVGLFEEMPQFMEVLEYLMPHIFSNITNVYDSVANRTKKFSLTIRKQELDADGLKHVQPQLKYEYMLHNTLLENFHALWSAIHELKSLEKSTVA